MTGEEIRTFTISQRASVRVGYPDGHIEIDISIPFSPWPVRFSIPPEDITKAKDAFDAAVEWVKKIGGVKKV